MRSPWIRCVIVLLLVPGIGVVAGCAGTSKPSPPSAQTARLADESAVAELEKQFARACLASDADAYTRLLADDFRGVNAIGTTHDKAHDVERMRAKNFYISQYNITDMATTAVGDAVIVTSIVRQTYVKDAGKWNGDYAVTNVWRRYGSAWQLFRSHWTKIDRDYAH